MYIDTLAKYRLGRDGINASIRNHFLIVKNHQEYLSDAMTSLDSNRIIIEIDKLIYNLKCLRCLAEARIIHLNNKPKV